MSTEQLFDATRIGFGFSTPAEASVIAQLEALGVESFWAGGHVAFPDESPEAMTFLARLAEQTQTAMIGTAVLLLPLYPPAIVAKQLAELDLASNGRVVVGVGVGGDYPKEFEACHVPFSERGPRTNEAMKLIRQLWKAESVDHPGPHYPFEGVRIHPAPSQPGGPPLIVAGRKTPAMRRAALLGDGWMPYLYSPRLYRESVEQIRSFANEAGRSLDRFAWMLWTPIHLDDDAPTKGAGVQGSTDAVIDQLREFVEAGVRYFVFHPSGSDPAAFGPDPVVVARKLRDLIMPALRSSARWTS